MMLMKCPSCGAEVGENNIFCLSCGTKLDTPLSSSATLPPLGSQHQSGTMVPPAAPSRPNQPLNSPTPAARQYQTPIQPQPGFTPATPLPNQRQFFTDPQAPIVSVGNWLGTFLLLIFIPLVLSTLAGVLSSLVELPPIAQMILGLLPGVVYLLMMFIWAFSKRVNPNKRNLFRAMLILLAIMIVLIIVLLVVAGTMLASMFGDLLQNGFDLDALMQNLENLQQLSL